MTSYELVLRTPDQEPRSTVLDLDGDGFFAAMDVLGALNGKLLPEGTTVSARMLQPPNRPGVRYFRGADYSDTVERLDPDGAARAAAAEVLEAAAAEAEARGDIGKPAGPEAWDWLRDLKWTYPQPSGASASSVQAKTAAACRLCGTDPAAGLATIGGDRYCHDGPSPTCYEVIQWRQRDALADNVLLRDPSFAQQLGAGSVAAFQRNVADDEGDTSDDLHLEYEVIHPGPRRTMGEVEFHRLLAGREQVHYRSRAVTGAVPPADPLCVKHGDAPTDGVCTCEDDPGQSADDGHAEHWKAMARDDRATAQQAIRERDDALTRLAAIADLPREWASQARSIAHLAHDVDDLALRLVRAHGSDILALTKGPSEPVCDCDGQRSDGSLCPADQHTDTDGIRS